MLQVVVHLLLVLPAPGPLPVVGLRVRALRPDLGRVENLEGKCQVEMQLVKDIC